jgi:hypothetical protein
MNHIPAVIQAYEDIARDNRADDWQDFIMEALEDEFSIYLEMIDIFQDEVGRYPLPVEQTSLKEATYAWIEQLADTASLDQ